MTEAHAQALEALKETRKAFANCIGDFSACRLGMTDDESRRLAGELLSDYRKALAHADLVLALQAKE